MKRKKINVYLSGAVKRVSNEFQSWRNECIELTDEDFGIYNLINCIDPTRYFNYSKNKTPKTEKQCLDLFMWQVEKSDVVLVNLDYSEVSPGTVAELEHAYCNGVPVIGFGKEEYTWYNWAKERCSVVFDNLTDALNYIDTSYACIK